MQLILLFVLVAVSTENRHLAAFQAAEAIMQSDAAAKEAAAREEEENDRRLRRADEITAERNRQYLPPVPVATPPPSPPIEPVSPAISVIGLLVTIAVFWVLGTMPFWILGALIGGRRRAASEGALLGLLFGPFGLLVSFFLDNRSKCPACASRLNDGARICANCRTEIASTA